MAIDARASHCEEGVMFPTLPRIEGYCVYLNVTMALGVYYSNISQDIIYFHSRIILVSDLLTFPLRDLFPP